MKRYWLALLLAVTCWPAFGESGITVKIKGKFQDGVYTSPDKSFSVRLPELTKPGIKIEDADFGNGEGYVSFHDDFCRLYYVHDVPLTTPYVIAAEVERFARDAVVPFWARMRQVTIESLAPVDIGRGPAVALRLREEKGPCGLMAFEGDRMVPKDQPGRVLSYQFVADGAAYDVGVMFGPLAEGIHDIGISRNEQREPPAPSDDVLRAFLVGLETRAHAPRLQRNGLREGIKDATAAGRIVAGEYVAPADRFRLRLPVLWGAARLEDVAPQPTESLLQISDELCRYYLVHPMDFGHRLSDEELRKLADGMASSFVESESATIKAVEPIDIGRGEGQALAIRYEMPPRSCDLGAVTGASRPETVPVDVTLLLFQEQGIVFEVLYARARATAPAPMFMRIEPGDELLRDLLAGLTTRPQ